MQASAGTAAQAEGEASQSPNSQLLEVQQQLAAAREEAAEAVHRLEHLQRTRTAAEQQQQPQQQGATDVGADSGPATEASEVSVLRQQQSESEAAASKAETQATEAAAAGAEAVAALQQQLAAKDAAAAAERERLAALQSRLDAQAAAAAVATGELEQLAALQEQLAHQAAAASEAAAAAEADRTESSALRQQLSDRDVAAAEAEARAATAATAAAEASQAAAAQNTSAQVWIPPGSRPSALSGGVGAFNGMEARPERWQDSACNDLTRLGVLWRRRLRRRLRRCCSGSWRRHRSNAGRTLHCRRRRPVVPTTSRLSWLLFSSR